MGRTMRRARTAQGLTQERAAERIGVSVEFYARIERGNAHPSVPTLYRIASAFEVSADALIGLDQAAAAAPVSLADLHPDDPPPVRRAMSRLREAPPTTRRLVEMLLKECERREGARRSSDDDDDDDDDSSAS
ncbi:helix-turn-helix transcriptional regulator [Haliangium ochraceum]|nr:helix-turn-helix transcriptional regulator [Haliangium ochraceum]